MAKKKKVAKPRTPKKVARKTARPRVVKKAAKKAPVPKAPPPPPVVLRSKFIKRVLSTEHQAFLDEFKKRPKASQSVSGQLNQILTRFPKMEADLVAVTKDRDALEQQVRFYVQAATRSAQASEAEGKALGELISFVKARPVDYERQLAMDLDDGYDDDDDGDDY